MTRSGPMLDAIGDRVFVFVAVCVFLFDGELSTWQYFIMISRDIMTACEARPMSTWRWVALNGLGR